MQQHQIYIGTSGWSYKHWKGTFYPEHIKVKDQFAYYLQNFNTVEINNTFYKLPTEETFLNWRRIVSSEFIYVIKASRYITHQKKLHDPAQSISLFMQRVKLLGPQLGPILFQLPPFMKSNTELLEAFLVELPEGFRYVFEFRSADWYSQEVFNLLRKYNCAFCIYELAGHFSPVEITADFVYIRLHGPDDKYQGSYSDQILKQWAQQCIFWSASKDVYIYFDNDQNGYAAFNALKLKQIIAGFQRQF